jgi:hypothetical protein
MRAVCWIGVVLVGWSLNLRWGDDVNVPNGPGPLYQKQVVGAMLLALLAALAISASQKWIAKGIAVAAGAGGALIAITLRSSAPETVTSGSGWLWMAAGAGAALLAAAATLLVRPPAPKKRGR